MSLSLLLILVVIFRAVAVYGKKCDEPFLPADFAPNVCYLPATAPKGYGWRFCAKLSSQYYPPKHICYYIIGRDGFESMECCREG